MTVERDEVYAVKASRFLFILFLSLLLIPAFAFAVDYTVSNGDTFNLDSCSSATNDTVTVAGGATATLTGTATGVPVSCEAGVTLTLNGVSIDTFASSDMCALSFTGSGNTLILSGNSTIKSGENESGIRVEDTTKLEIYGDGSLDVTGGFFSAGIGGGIVSICGDITISGGTVTAAGNAYGAGIGGGYGGIGGTIEISGGTVTATGGVGGAGIGCGYYGGSGRKTTISGGTVTATGGIGGAGIGCGFNGGDGGTIEISGGMVTATGGEESTLSGFGGGAGIGGGGDSGGGTISLTGGLTYAEGKENALDIGNGSGGSGGTLAISNTAAAFLENDTRITPSLPNSHEHKTPSDTVNPMIFNGDEVYGLTVPSAWTSSQGGYFRLYTVSYDANGGKGTPPNSPPVQHIGTGLTVAGGSGLTKAGYILSGWNTQAGGGGATYRAGSTLTLAPDITLYALWMIPYTMPQTGDDRAALLYLFAGLALAPLLGMTAITIRKRRKRFFR